MLLSKCLSYTVLFVTIGLRLSAASMLNDAEVIWRAGMPIEDANVALHQRVVESLHRDAGESDPLADGIDGDSRFDRGKAKL